MKGLWLFLAAGIALAQGTDDQTKFPQLLTCSRDSSEWAFSSYGNAVGQGGIIIEDFNGNGTPEAILTGICSFNNRYNHFWHVIEYDGQSFRQIHVGPYYDSEIVKMLQTVNAANQSQLMVVLASGKVAWVDPESYQQVDQVQLAGMTQIQDLVRIDLQGDGTVEWVVSDGTDLFVYRGVAPYDLLQVYDDKGGAAIAVGSLDGDPGLEIAVEPDNGHGFVIDGVTGEIEWDYPAGFGELLLAGDIDGDGRDELVGGDSSVHVSAFDVEQKAIKWSQNQKNGLDAMKLADVEGDGVAEVLIGEGHGGDTLCREGATGMIRWKIKNPEPGVARVEVGDINGDHQLDLVWGSFYAFLNGDRLFFADVTNRTPQWTSHYFEGAFDDLGAGDLDGDQIPELFTITADGVVLVFDGASKRLVAEHTIPIFYEKDNGLAIGDVDNDGDLEYIIVANDISGGLLQVFNGQTHLIEWQSGGHLGSDFNSISLANIDNDPQLEIIVGETVGHTYARYRVFDKVNAIEQYASTPVEANFYSQELLVEDLDGDGGKEIVLATIEGVFIYDATTHQQKAVLGDNALSFCLTNADSDEAQELLIGSFAGVVSIYDCSTFLQQGSERVFDGYVAIRHLQAIDLNGDHQPEWVAMSPNKLVILDRVTSEVWSPDECGAVSYTASEVVVADLDGDHTIELFVGMGATVRLIETPYCDFTGFYQALPTWPNVGVLSLLQEICP